MIWILFSGSNSLWVAWHRFHHCATNFLFWSQTESQDHSGNWKCLLRLRNLASRFLSCTVGNGQQASFWFDKWTPLGPLIEAIGTDSPRRLRIPANATVAAACNEVGWILPSPRSDQELALHAFLTTISIPHSDKGRDTFDWSTNGSHGTFSSANTWEILRPRDEEKSWSKLIWFKGATPKHAFNMWVANLNRLPTRQRLTAWGMQIPHLCCICSSATETRDHLLVACVYATEIWEHVFSRIGRPRGQFIDWQHLLSWLKQSVSRSTRLLRMLSAQAVVYSVWKQRNNVLHNQVSIPPQVIFKEVNRTIINTIHARRSRRRFQNLMAKWLT